MSDITEFLMYAKMLMYIKPFWQQQRIMYVL